MTVKVADGRSRVMTGQRLPIPGGYFAMLPGSPQTAESESVPEPAIGARVLAVDDYAARRVRHASQHPLPSGGMDGTVGE